MVVRRSAASLCVHALVRAQKSPPLLKPSARAHLPAA